MLRLLRHVVGGDVMGARWSIVQGVSRNKKLGMAGATYTDIPSTCGPCPLRNPDPETGLPKCYALTGRVGIHAGKLAARVEAESRHLAESPARALEVARDEAEQIDALPRGLPLRLHVSGDCRTAAAARVVAAAADRYQRRAGVAAWSYTHAWRTVPRAAWGGVSVLASCETASDAARAVRRGWAVTLVVPDLRAAAGRAIGTSGLRGVACRYDLARVPCSECRLCWDDRRLQADGLAILFGAA